MNERMARGLEQPEPTDHELLKSMASDLARIRTSVVVLTVLVLVAALFIGYAAASSGS